MNMQTDGRRTIWFSYGEPVIQCKSPKICSYRDLLSRNSKRTRATARPIQVRSTDEMFSQILDNKHNPEPDKKKVHYVVREVYLYIRTQYSTVHNPLRLQHA
jgi:hypothetical protein